MLPRRAKLLLSLIGFVLVCGALWHFTDVGAIAGAQLRRWLWHMPRAAHALALVVAGYALVTALGMSVTVAIGICAVTLGTWVGFWVSLSGSLMSAAIGYALGRWLGAGILERLVPRRARAIRTALQRSGALSTMILRTMPVAPYALVSLVAGACRVRLRDYAFGTLLGTVPYVLAFTALTNRILTALRQPDAASIGALLFVCAISMALLSVMLRWATRYARSPAP